MTPLFERLCLAGRRELEEAFLHGRRPDLASVTGWEWRGWNCAWFTDVLRIRKFIKGFHSPSSGPAGGYNIPARQNRLEEPWRHVPGPAEPRRFGFYTVTPGGRALLLDYGASPLNARWRPERVIRDLLTMPDPAEPDVLLGKAYLALGPARVFSNFFVLSRLRRTPWRP